MTSLKTLGSSDADAVFHTWKETEVRVQRLVTLVDVTEEEEENDRGAEQCQP